MSFRFFVRIGVMSKSLFEKIANKEIPAFMIWEDEKFMAFLDINPLSKGHTLVVPKENWGDYLFGLADDKYLELLTVTKKVAEILEKNLDCKRILMIVEGLEVAHVHIKLVPTYDDQGLQSMRGKSVSMEELKAVQQQIMGE